MKDYDVRVFSLNSSSSCRSGLRERPESVDSRRQFQTFHLGETGTSFSFRAASLVEAPPSTSLNLFRYKTGPRESNDSKTSLKIIEGDDKSEDSVFGSDDVDPVARVCKISPIFNIKKEHEQTGSLNGKRCTKHLPGKLRQSTARYQ